MCMKGIVIMNEVRLFIGYYRKEGGLCIGYIVRNII